MTPGTTLSRDENLVRWDKHPANPIIPNPGPGDEYRIRGASCAWVEGDLYYALTGNSGYCPPDPDTAYLFKSSNLADWEYMHPFYEGGRFTGWGEDCGCPDFFPLGNKHVLFFTSHLRGTQCYIGTYSDHRFIPERHQRLAFATGQSRYGVPNEGLTLLDDQGRRILFQRIHEGRYDYIQRASGWAGIMALPMVLSLSDEGDLLLEPVPQLQTLRTHPEHVSDVALKGDSTVPLAGIRGDSLEIQASFEGEGAEEFGLMVRCSPEGEEQTLIRFRPLHQELILDVTRSSVSPEVCNRESQHCTFDRPDGERLELRVFVDRSVVEVFANGLHYLAKRIYPARPDSLGVQAFSRGGNARLQSLEAWQMRPIW